jgi:MFS transporter, DHA3 family, macrolide efflux protein
MMGNRPVTFSQVLSNRRFLSLWLAQLVSSAGDWLAIVALFSLVTYGIKGTPFQVSSMMIAYVIPAALVGPFAGVFVDRWNIKWTMIASDVFRAVIVALIAFVTSLTQLYVLVFLLSAVSSFFMPAQTVAIPLIVKKQELLVANALNAQTFHFTKVLGPAVAGLIVGWAGEKACFLFDSVSFLFSAAMISTLALNRKIVRAEKGLPTILRDLSEGLKFILSQRALLFVIISMSAAILALGAFDALISIYVRDILRRGPEVFGWLISLVGVGTIFASFALGKYGQRYSKVYLVVIGILVIGIGVLIIALFGSLPVALICTAFFGVGVALVLVPAQTLMQENTPQSLLGRVSSASMSMMTVAQLISFLLAAVIAVQIGIINLYITVAAMLLAIAIAGFVYAKTTRVSEAQAPATD